MALEPYFKPLNRIQFAKAEMSVIALPKMRVWMSYRRKDKSIEMWVYYLIFRRLTLVPEK